MINKTTTKTTTTGFPSAPLTWNSKHSKHGLLFSFVFFVLNNNKIVLYYEQYVYVLVQNETR